MARSENAAHPWAAPYGSANSAVGLGKGQKHRLSHVASAGAGALPSRKASRASQGGGAEERPMFERSEFGPRATLSEKLREPIRRSRSGSRPAKTVLPTFALTKVGRAAARKPLLSLLSLPFVVRKPSKEQSFRSLRAPVPF